VVSATSHQETPVRDGDDDGEYHAAVGRTWLTLVLGLGCFLTLTSAVVADVLGFLGLADVLSLVAD
jgi:hypothetical protein